MKTHVKGRKSKKKKKNRQCTIQTYRVNIVHRITQVRLQFSDSALQFILLVQQSMDVIDSYNDSNRKESISSFANGLLMAHARHKKRQEGIQRKTCYMHVPLTFLQNDSLTSMTIAQGRNDLHQRVESDTDVLSPLLLRGDMVSLLLSLGEKLMGRLLSAGFCRR